MRGYSAEEIWLPEKIKLPPRRVQQLPSETAYSLLWRLAQANGYSEPRFLLQSIPELTKPLRTIGQRRQIHVELAARLSGTALPIIDYFTPYRDAEFQIIRGHQFWAKKIAANGRICPACLTEDMENVRYAANLRPYRRDWWQLFAIRHCPFHQCELVDECPGCQRPLKQNDAPHGCGCDPHVDLRRIPPRFSTPEDLTHDRWLLGRLGVDEPQPHPFLDDLPLDCGTELCLILGTVADAKEAFSSTTSPRKREHNGTRSIGFEILRNWPSSFEDMLDNTTRKMRPLLKPHTLYTKHYGGLYGLLSKNKSSSFDCVKDVVAGHISRNFFITPRSTAFDKSLYDPNRTSLWNFSQEIDVNIDLIIRILNDSGVYVNSSDARDFYMSQTHKNDVIRFLDETVDCGRLHIVIGCTRVNIDEMAHLGILRRAFLPHPRRLGRVYKADFNAILEAISAENLPDISEVMDALPARQLTKSDICSGPMMISMLLSNDLQAVAKVPDEVGFRALGFRLTDVLEALERSRGIISRRRGSKEYGWQKGTISELRKLGLLSGSPLERSLDVAEFRRVAAEHVTLKEMMTWQGATFQRKALRNALADANVEPVVELGEGTTELWNRSKAREVFAAFVESRASGRPKN